MHSFVVKSCVVKEITDKEWLSKAKIKVFKAFIEEPFTDIDTLGEGIETLLCKRVTQFHYCIIFDNKLCLNY